MLKSCIRLLDKKLWAFQFSNLVIFKGDFPRGKWEGGGYQKKVLFFLDAPSGIYYIYIYMYYRLEKSLCDQYKIHLEEHQPYFLWLWNSFLRTLNPRMT